MGSFNTTCILTQQTIAPGERCFVVPILQQVSYTECVLEDTAEVIASRARNRELMKAIRAASGKDKKKTPFKQRLGGLKESFGAWLQKAGRELQGLPERTARATHNSTCYSHAFWAPMTPWVEGTYDDYGFVAVEESWEAKVALWAIINDSFKTLEGDNKCHDVAFDPDHARTLGFQEKWAYVWQAAVDEARVFSTSYGNPAPVNFAIICGPAMDYIRKRMEHGRNWLGEPTDLESVLSRHFEDKLEGTDLKCYFANAFATNTTRDGDDGFSVRMLTWSCENLLGSGEGSRSRSKQLFSQRLLMLARDAAMSNEDKADQAVALLKKLVTDNYVDVAFNSFNAHYEPLAYASQDYSNEIGRDFAALIAAVEPVVTAGRKDDDDEPSDD